MYELQKILNEGLDQEQFEFVKNSWFNSLPVAVDTPARVLDLAMQGFELGYGDDYLSYMMSELNKVTVDDVNQVAKKWLQDVNVTFIFVTPNPNELKERLINEVTSNVTYAAADLPDGVLVEDEIIKHYPLGFHPSNVRIVSASELFPGASDDIVTPVDEKESSFVTEDFRNITSITENEVSNTVTSGSAGESETTNSVETSSNPVGGGESDTTNKDPLLESMNGDDVMTTDLDITSDAPDDVASSSLSSGGVTYLSSNSPCLVLASAIIVMVNLL